MTLYSCRSVTTILSPFKTANLCYVDDDKTQNHTARPYPNGQNKLIFASPQATGKAPE